MCSTSLFISLFFALCVEMISSDHYFVKSAEKNSTCIILDSNITGILHYKKPDNSTDHFKFNVTGEADGSCEGDQYITIRFYPYNVIDMGIWNLTIDFKRRSDDSFRISNFTLETYLHPKKFNATEPYHMYLMDEHAELNVGANKHEAFQCSDVALSFEEYTTVNLRNMRLIAYAHLNTTKFPKNQEYDICQLDIRTSDIVPIVVGACLAALVIVVLIAYLIGRARAKRQGYASV